MARVCLGPGLVGESLHNQCQCKQRAETLFKSIDKTLMRQAQSACTNGNPNDLQTAQDFANAMNLSEAEILRNYGTDINKENGEQSPNVTPQNQKIIYFGLLVLLLLIIYFVAQKS